VKKSFKSIIIRIIDLSLPLHPISILEEYNIYRLLVTLKGLLIDQFDINNLGQSKAISRLKEAIIERFFIRLFWNYFSEKVDAIWADTVKIFNKYFIQKKPEPISLSEEIFVSILVSILDRPNALRKYLQNKVDSAGPLAL
jgi:hypothetical protein